MRPRDDFPWFGLVFCLAMLGLVGTVVIRAACRLIEFFVP